MTRIAPVALALAIGLALNPAFAAEPLDDEALRELVRQQSEQIRHQQAQIDQLNQRLSALESAPAQAAVATAAGGAAPVAGTASVDPIQAQVQAAIAASRQDQGVAVQYQMAQAAQGGGTGGGDVRWRRGGPEFRSSDGKFRFHPRGRVAVDFTSTRGSGFDARNIAGSTVRAVRLGAEGQLGALGYKIDADFADNEVSIKDAYLSYDTRLGGLPAEFYVGNKLKDRSIEGATTLTRTPFMERNAVASVGSPDVGYFGLGAHMKLIGSNWHLGLGVAGDDLSNAGDTGDSVVYNVRAHWNPVKRGAGFLHLGGWYWYEDLAADVESINKVPRIALDFNDEVRVSASSISGVTDDRAWGVEFGGVYRNLWGFGEYTRRTIDSSSEPSVDHAATSVYAGWLLTGEKAAFSSRSGVWGTTRVLRPVGEGGYGALELAARYDRYDFTDAARGGEGDAWTLGLNWYLNDWSRLMLNYVHWTTDNQVGAYRGPDSGNTLGVRAQVVF